MVIYIKFHLCVTRLKISWFGDSKNYFLQQGNKTKLANDPAAFPELQGLKPNPSAIRGALFCCSCHWYCFDLSCEKGLNINNKNLSLVIFLTCLTPIYFSQLCGNFGDWYPIVLVEMNSFAVTTETGEGQSVFRISSLGWDQWKWWSTDLCQFSLP